MDASGLTGEIRIERADDDPPMVRMLLMETNEVPPVEGHQSAPVLGGEDEDGGIRDGSAGISGFLDRQDVVPQSAELFGDLEREILVRVEPRHRSGGLVVSDLPLDLVAVSPLISPGVCQILRP
jgi:hypothetical protein